MGSPSLLGINFYRGTYAGYLDEVIQRIEAKKTALIVTPNPEMLADAGENSALLNILKNADYALPDGAGIFVAYQITTSTLPEWLKYFSFPYWCFQAVFHDSSFREKYGERITGSRLTRDLMSYANEKNIPVTIIDPIVSGDTPGDRAKKISQAGMGGVLQRKYPNTSLRVIVSDTVPDSLPENGIVFATHGGGKQEILLSEVVKKFPACGLALGVGGSIDLITGFRTPAPLFFQKFGLEWFYRLIKNPKKHLKRIKKVIRFLHTSIKK